MGTDGRIATANGRTEGRGMTELKAPGRAGVHGRPPLVLRWGGPHRPLPVQEVRGVGRPGYALAGRPAVFGSEPPPWLPTGPEGEPLDFSAHVRRLCADIAFRCAELAHVATSRILFAFTQARNGRTHGLQARVTPLRFRGGQLVRRHRGINYQVQRLFVGDEEILYLMTFCLPRFFNQGFDDKLVTLFHELFHIGPQCDGDLRRHAGRYAVHSHSQRRYDERMAGLARAYLNTKPDPGLHAFLRLNFAQLRQRHGSVVGVIVPRPKLVPLPDALA
jgi:predicted metallopeptidase